MFEAIAKWRRRKALRKIAKKIIWEAINNETKWNPPKANRNLSVSKQPDHEPRH